MVDTSSEMRKNAMEKLDDIRRKHKLLYKNHRNCWMKLYLQKILLNMQEEVNPRKILCNTNEKMTYKSITDKSITAVFMYSIVDFCK